MGIKKIDESDISVIRDIINYEKETISKWQFCAKEEVSVCPKAGWGSGNDLISQVQGVNTKGVKNKGMSKESLGFWN